MFNKGNNLYAAVLLSAALCVLIASPARTAVSTDIKLLLTGVFYPDEVNAETGERWLGLFKTDTGFELAGTVVTVEIVEDAKPGGSGKRVSVDREGELVFMVKGVRSLKEGPVTTAFSGRVTLEVGHQVDVELAGVKYTLSVSGEGEQSWNWQDYRIVLTRDGVSQRILDLERCCNDRIPSLIWAGDIDGDGAIDLFLDLTDHYVVTRPTLLLSSLAGEGELVGKAAEIVTTGC